MSNFVDTGEKNASDYKLGDSIVVVSIDMVSKHIEQSGQPGICA